MSVKWQKQTVKNAHHNNVLLTPSLKKRNTLSFLTYILLNASVTSRHVESEAERCSPYS